MKKAKLSVCINILFAACLIFAWPLRASPAAGCPILVLAGDGNFGFFTGEILKTEGFNEFEMDSLSDSKLSAQHLKRFDIVILAENDLTGKQREILREYVKLGGCLIAFRPDRKLSDVFGIKVTEGTFSEGYIAVDTSTGIGKGIVPDKLQIHADADKYLLSGAKKIASLYDSEARPTRYPAVVVNDYGKGHALAFLYNLNQSIAYTRQVNYRLAGWEMDGIPGIRAMDMFTNGWVDTSKNIMNQADEQMRLLSHGIETMSRYFKPLPRFWYFPDTLNCVVTLTNDGEDSREEDFEPQFQEVHGRGAMMTLYVKEVDLISKAWVRGWISKGFEVSGHPDDTKQLTNPDWKTMDGVYRTLIRKINSRYGITEISTVTNHFFLWCGKNENGKRDFMAQARIEEKNGIELDCNYAHYDNNSNQGHFLGPTGINQGNFTGSGLIMKFTAAHGKPVNVYQQLNNVYDQQYMEHGDQEGFYNCFKGLMDRSLNHEVYSFISIKAHNNEYWFSKIPLMRMLDYSHGKGIPVWTELDLLKFLKTKDGSSFRHINWSGNRLSFSIKSSLADSKEVTCLIPYRFQGKRVEAIVDNGVTGVYMVKTIKGTEYALLKINSALKNEILVSYINL